MDLQLKDKVVIVTGGAKGIGAAITRMVAGEGAIPVIVDRDPDAGEKSQSDLRQRGNVSDLIVVDLATPEACSKAVEQTMKKFGRINALVNNAGVNDGVGLEKGSPDQFVASLQRNLLHYYNMVYYSLPSLKRTQGTIVNIGSKTAVTGQGGTSGYVASKGAILALTREWAVELLPYGIRVNAIAPGPIATPMSQMVGAEQRQAISRTIPLGRKGQPEDIGEAAAFLVSDAASFITGATLPVSGGSDLKVFG